MSVEDPDAEAEVEGIQDLAGIYADAGFNLQDFLADRHGKDDQA